MSQNQDPKSRLMTLAHPWHGISAGKDAPRTVNAFIEIVPIDTVKYEVDKESGHLKVDRPQKYSSTCPAPYGFIPQTLCGPRVAGESMRSTGKQHVVGDGDPMDICVLTERTINHGAIILKAHCIGGFRLLDGGEADDKIVAVLHSDPTYGHYTDISEIPVAIVERLKHYFLTYKQMPQSKRGPCQISEVYGHQLAHRVIQQSMLDYQEWIDDATS